jgi:hypothetical protein
MWWKKIDFDWGLIFWNLCLIGEYGGFWSEFNQYTDRTAYQIPFKFSYQIHISSRSVCLVGIAPTIFKLGLKPVTKRNSNIGLRRGAMTAVLLTQSKMVMHWAWDVVDTPAPDSYILIFFVKTSILNCLFHVTYTDDFLQCICADLLTFCDAVLGCRNSSVGAHICNIKRNKTEKYVQSHHAEGRVDPDDLAKKIRNWFWMPQSM